METKVAEEPQVTRRGVLDMQVCVPCEWSDEDAEQFANAANPSGIGSGWQMRQNGSEWLAGSPERVACQERAGYVHIMLDC